MSGEISRTVVFREGGEITGKNWTGNSVAGIPASNFTTLGTWMLPASPFQPHLPTLNMNVSIYGSGVQAAVYRVLWSNGNQNNFVELFLFQILVNDIVLHQLYLHSHSHQDLNLYQEFQK